MHSFRLSVTRQVLYHIASVSFTVLFAQIGVSFISLSIQIWVSFNIRGALQPCRSFSGFPLSPQVHLQLSSPLIPFGEDASSMVHARLQQIPETAETSHEQELLGTTSVAAICGVARFTDLRIDRAGVYTIQFENIFVGSFAAMTAVSRVAATLVFQVLPGVAHQLRVVAHPAGMCTGKVFLAQPVIEVVDVGRNRLLDGAPAVTAICYPRPLCEIGQAIFVNGRAVLVYLCMYIYICI